MLRDAPADGAAVRPARRGRGREAGQDMTRTDGRPCCLRPRIVLDGHEMVCSACGAVADERLPDSGGGRDSGRAESGVLAARVRVDCEDAVGTRDISPPSVLRSRRHRRMLEGARDPFDAALQRACGMLSLPPACCRRAAHIARAVRARCAGGAPLRRPSVAYFAIYRTCAEYGTGASEADMAGAVRAAFAVRRTFRPRHAVFAVEALLVESGGGEGVDGCLGAGAGAGGGGGGDEGGGREARGEGEGGGGMRPPTDAEAAASSLRRIASEPLRRSALRLCDAGAPLALAVEIARRLEPIGAAAAPRAVAA